MLRWEQPRSRTGWPQCISINNVDGAFWGLPEVQDREAVGQNLSEDGIYVGDLEDATEATGKMEGVGDLGWAGQ